MAVFLNTPSLPKFQQPMSRRAVMSTGIVATALAAVPVPATAEAKSINPAEGFDHEFETIVQEMEACGCTVQIEIAAGRPAPGEWIGLQHATEHPSDALARYAAIERFRRERHLLATGRFFVRELKEPSDLIAKSEERANKLLHAMNEAHPGDWRAVINRESRFVLLIDDAHNSSKSKKRVRS